MQEAPAAVESVAVPVKKKIGSREPRTTKVAAAASTSTVVSTSVAEPESVGTAPQAAPTPTAKIGSKTVKPLVPTQTGAPGTEQLSEEAVPGLRGAADTSIRVDVDLLDALMRQVGELVLARNQISRLATGTDDVDLSRSAQRLNLIAGELQEGVMKTRMQPIEHVWSKMPRIVRDLAAACTREVQLEMTGGDTELDRGLLEAVKDPLTHLVRNAVDHGIERRRGPHRRRQARQGRADAARLPLGRPGRRRGRRRRRAASTRHASPPRPSRRACAPSSRSTPRATRELLQLLFLPGFSTAAAVTNVSGRGVGMDVVRTNVEAIGGTVDIDSTLGVGTVWRLRIPLTLAIMPALTVECAGDLYAVPQINLLELVALDGQRSGSGIEYVHSAPGLPAARRPAAARVPRRCPRRSSRARPTGTQTSVIAVVQADQQRFGLLVDRVLNTEEIVVKPLSSAAQVDRRLRRRHGARRRPGRADPRRRRPSRAAPSSVTSRP